jgi:hypothetical protein
VEFRLLYEGPLVAAQKGKTRASEKQALRRHFHQQLARLWLTNPNLLRMAHQQGFYAALSRTGSIAPDSLIVFNQQPGVFVGVLSDSQSGVIAQVEYANNRLTYSLERRAKTIDALLHEWKSDVLCIWIPLVAGAALLIGLFSGMSIQGWRDSVPATTATPTPTAMQVVPVSGTQEDTMPSGDPKKPHHRMQAKAKIGTEHER